jgi:hypothetical protein
VSIVLHRLAVCVGVGALVLVAGHSSAAVIGVNFTGTTKSGIRVPDTMGAVGPNHVVEALNGSIAVYDKTNGRLVRREGADSFWNAALRRGSGGSVEFLSSVDPRVVYDPTSSRWFVSYLDFESDGSTHVLLGISDGNSPVSGQLNSLLNGWKGYELDGDPSAQPDRRWSDFPTLGVARDSITMSTKLIDIANQGTVEPLGIAVYSIPKSDLLQSTPTVANRSQFTFAQPTALGRAVMTVQGVVDNGPANGRAALFAVNAEVGLQRWDVMNTAERRAGAAMLSSPISIPIDPFVVPPTGNQPGTVQDLYNDGPFTSSMLGSVTNLMKFSSNLVQQGNRAWGTHSVKAGDRSGVRWYEIDLAANQVVQSGTISDPAIDLIYPSIAVNGFGDAVIGFTATGENLFPSAYAVVGSTVGGVTTFGSLMELKRGVSTFVDRDAQGRNRWGDYSQTVVDPSDPLRFWTFQEFASARDQWAVQITEIVIPEPSTLILFACGLLVTAFAARWRRRTH